MEKKKRAHEKMKKEKENQVERGPINALMVAKLLIAATTLRHLVCTCFYVHAILILTVK